MAGGFARIAAPLLLFAICSLGGCMDMGKRAHAPAVAPPPLPLASVAPRGAAKRLVPVPKPKKPDRTADTSVAQPKLALRRDPLPAIEPESLLGLDPDAVQKRLGAPMRVESDTLSREWVYASSRCSFHIFFYPDIKTNAFHVLKYGSNDDSGGRLSNSDACIRRILMARNNAAN
jgi:hypothetical protein